MLHVWLLQDLTSELKNVLQSLIDVFSTLKELL